MLSDYNIYLIINKGRGSCCAVNPADYRQPGDLSRIREIPGTTSSDSVQFLFKRNFIGEKRGL